MLELETLLEAGLYALGVTLGRRVYADELKAERQISKDFAEGDIKAMIAGTIRMHDRDEKGGAFEFFKRTASWDEWTLSYAVDHCYPRKWTPEDADMILV